MKLKRNIYDLNQIREEYQSQLQTIATYDMGCKYPDIDLNFNLKWVAEPSAHTLLVTWIGTSIAERQKWMGW